MKRTITLAAGALAIILVGCNAAETQVPAAHTEPSPVVVAQPSPVAIQVTPAPVVTPEPSVSTGAIGTTEEIEEDLDEPVQAVTPFGTWQTVGDWSVRFAKTTNFNAWKAVHKANSFNDKPPAGYRDVMAWVEYKYLGTDREAFDPMFTLRAVGPAGIEYTQFEDPNCGVLPKPDIGMTDPKLRHGGVGKGWVCWTVEAGDANANLTAFTEFFADYDDESYAEFALK